MRGPLVPFESIGGRKLEFFLWISGNLYSSDDRFSGSGLKTAGGAFLVSGSYPLNESSKIELTL